MIIVCYEDKLKLDCYKDKILEMPRSNDNFPFGIFFVPLQTDLMDLVSPISFVFASLDMNQMNPLIEQFINNINQAQNNNQEQ